MNEHLATLKYCDKKLTITSFDTIKTPQKLEIDKYERTNLTDVNDLIKKSEKDITIGDNIVDLANGKEIYFIDIFNFLNDIKNGKINNFNREIEYKKKFKNTEIKLENRIKYSKNIRLYEEYLNDLRKLLFTKKSLGRGLTISSLPILLSKIYTNNNSKELINDIKQLVKILYDNKQITKEVYDMLNKALMSTIFTKTDS